MRKAILSPIVVLGLLAAFVVPQQVEGQGLTYVGPACTYGAVVAYVGTSPSYLNTDCSGAWDGNNKNQMSELLYEMENNGGFAEGTWGTGWTDAGSTDEGTNPFTTSPTGTAGELTFSAPFSGAFVLILKAANAFSMYYFAGVTAVTSVTYTTNGVALNAEQLPQGLSHATLLTRSTNVVPEPSTFILLGTGLLGLGIVGYRRRNQA